MTAVTRFRGLGGERLFGSPERSTAMKQFLFAAASIVLLVAPSAAHAATTPMAASTYGVGPHGYDWALGTWSCHNAMPSSMGGPATQTLTVTRAAGAIMYHATGPNFDNTWYNV